MVENAGSGSNVGAVVGALLSVVLLLMLVGSVVAYKRYGRSHHGGDMAVSYSKGMAARPRSSSSSSASGISRQTNSRPIRLVDFRLEVIMTMMEVVMIMLMLPRCGTTARRLAASSPS